jgi:hypothetical protein
MFAWVYEQHDSAAPATPTSRTVGLSFSQPAASTTVASTAAAPASSVASIAKPSAVRCLLPLEIAERRKDGRCFCCDEPFTHGNKEVCKQLFTIEVIDEADDRDTPPTRDDPTISLHALTGIQPCTGHTMQVTIHINGVQLIILLDLGSTHNFVDIDADERAELLFKQQASLRVKVANDDRL